MAYWLQSILREQINPRRARRRIGNNFIDYIRGVRVFGFKDRIWGCSIFEVVLVMGGVFGWGREWEWEDGVGMGLGRYGKGWERQMM
jgi:hypothetical protein